MTFCACGRAISNGGAKGKCKRCYDRSWRATRKMAGGRRIDGYKIPAVDEWFDWVMVERAWEGGKLPRKLTHAERLELAYRAVATGLTRNVNLLRDVLHMPIESAVRLAESVASGEVKVMGRSPLGAPTQWLPAPVSGA